jgi:hypothetical protein
MFLPVRFQQSDLTDNNDKHFEKVQSYFPLKLEPALAVADGILSTTKYGGRIQTAHGISDPVMLLVSCLDVTFFVIDLLIHWLSFPVALISLKTVWRV